MNWTGLAAMAWDPSGGDREQPDYLYLLEQLKSEPGPALDIGCGTGRILVRLLQHGLDVDGIDTSAEMLNQCRVKAAAHGFQPTLISQGMQSLAMPRRYQTIYIPCGTFVLVTDRDEAWETLRRCHAHLIPGGRLIMNVFWPFGKGEPLSDEPSGGDNEYGPLMAHTLADGQRIVQTYKRLEINRVEQIIIAKRRYQLFDGDKLVAEEIFDANERWYYKHELQLMLERVGFQVEGVKGNWTADNFNDQHHDSMVMIARRGAAAA
jgi:ubiquinone/menaquinone biosynthesis C-methylase UbiE